MGTRRGRETQAPIAQLHERLTANCVARLYPRTRAVLDAMGVHAQFEGSDCLDEIAWRRGLPTARVIAELSAFAMEPQAGA
jgi:hypothetical protein